MRPIFESFLMQSGDKLRARRSNHACRVRGPDETASIVAPRSSRPNSGGVWTAIEPLKPHVVRTDISLAIKISMRGETY
jgi:hypothetical protein